MEETINRYRIIYICLSHFISFIYLFRNTQRDKTRMQEKENAKHREGQGSTRMTEGQVEKEYQQVQNYFTFVYQSSSVLFRNTQRGGTRMQEKDKGHAQQVEEGHQ